MAGRTKKVGRLVGAILKAIGYRNTPRPVKKSVGCQRFWTVLGPRDWGEEAPGLRVSLTS